MEKYKTLEDFHEVVEQTISLYYGKGFELCKKQVMRLHPELNIQDMKIDDKLAWKEEDGEDEKEEGNEEKKKEEGEFDNNPLSP